MRTVEGTNKTPAATEFLPSFGSFFIYGAARNDMWQFFNPKKRIWEFLKIQKDKSGSYPNSVILRNGWIIKKLEKRRSSFYYLVKDNKIMHINYTQAAKELKNYLNEEIEVTGYRENNFLKMDLNDVYFPIDEYKKIMDIDGIVVFEHRLMYVPIEHLTQFQSILKEIGIGLVISDESKEEIHLTEDISITGKISELLTLLYSKYLKKESEIEELTISLLSRKIDTIADPEVRKNLEFMTRDNLSEEERLLADFLTKTVVTYFDWKVLSRFNIDSSLDGLVLGTTPKDFQGNWTWNYLKIILPNFESVIHLQTTISPSKKGTGKMHPLSARLNKIEMKKWRLYPYLGKLKNTGTKEEISFEDGNFHYKDLCFRTISGIPTIEKVLSKMCFVDSFSLDLEEWKGLNNLSRYFLAYVRVIEPLDFSAKTPCMIVEDFFGNRFRISWDFNTYLHYAQDIHSIERNGFISIIVKNLLESGYLEKEEIDFKTVFGLSFRFVNKSEFISRNILALIKYVGYTNIKLLISFISSFSGPDTDNMISELEKKHQIHIRGNICYYSYNILNIDQFSYLIDMMENPESIPPKEFFNERWYVLWSLMRENLPIIHPLSYSTNMKNASDISDKISNMEAILGFIGKTKEIHKHHMQERAERRTNYLINTRKPDIQFQDTLVGKKDESAYIDHAKYMFRQFGQASIKARGKWIPKAHYIAKYLSRLFSYMEPSITRSDKTEKDPSGRNVREVEFYVEAFKIK